MTAQIGKMIIVVGAVLIVTGLGITFADRIPFIGRLPGDIHIKRGNFQIYLPVATSILVSVVLSLVVWLVKRR